MPVNFTDIDVHDDRFKHIKVILLMTECSRSAVTNPVDFIVSEGEGRFPKYPRLKVWLSGNRPRIMMRSVDNNVTLRLLFTMRYALFLKVDMKEMY